MISDKHDFLPQTENKFAPSTSVVSNADNNDIANVVSPNSGADAERTTDASADAANAFDASDAEAVWTGEGKFEPTVSQK